VTVPMKTTLMTRMRVVVTIENASGKYDAEDEKKSAKESDKSNYVFHPTSDDPVGKNSGNTEKLDKYPSTTSSDSTNQRTIVPTLPIAAALLPTLLQPTAEVLAASILESSDTHSSPTLPVARVMAVSLEQNGLGLGFGWLALVD
jgi:hypothetical protein